jgi:hypothetical protein
MRMIVLVWEYRLGLVRRERIPWNRQGREILNASEPLPASLIHLAQVVNETVESNECEIKAPAEASPTHDRIVR